MTFEKKSQINFYPQQFFFTVAIDINLILILKMLLFIVLTAEVKR